MIVYLHYKPFQKNTHKKKISSYKHVMIQHLLVQFRSINSLPSPTPIKSSNLNDNNEGLYSKYFRHTTCILVPHLASYRITSSLTQKTVYIYIYIYSYCLHLSSSWSLPSLSTFNTHSWISILLIQTILNNSLSPSVT